MDQFACVIVEIVIVGKTFVLKVFLLVDVEINAQTNAVVEGQSNGHVNTIVRLIGDSTEFTRDGPVHFAEALKNGDEEKNHDVES
jgi:hypothetical protein